MVPGAEEMGDIEEVPPPSYGLMAAALDLHLVLIKLLIPMTLSRCHHLSGLQCLHLYNGDKKRLGLADPRVQSVLKSGKQ